MRHSKKTIVMYAGKFPDMHTLDSADCLQLKFVLQTLFSQLFSPISTLKWALRWCFSLLQIKFSLQQSSVELLQWNVIAGESDHQPVTINSCGLYTCVMFCSLPC